MLGDFALLWPKNLCCQPRSIGFTRALFAKVFRKQSSLRAFGFGHIFTSGQTRADGIDGWATRFSATTEAAACTQQAKQTQQQEWSIGFKGERFSRF